MRVLGQLGVELLDESGEAVESVGDDLGSQVAGIRLGLGAVLVGVAEDADDVEARLGEEGLELVEIGLGLAGEADDDVAPDAASRAHRRAPASRSRKASREPKRRIERSSDSDACWKEMS